MAKKKKESGLPIVIALVFFVLTTIGLGVFCYVLYSDQLDKDKAVEAAKKEVAAAAKLAKVADYKASVYRIVMGIQDKDEVTNLTNESTPGDDYVTELKTINDKITQKLASINAADKPTTPLEAKNVVDWAPDGNNSLPTTGPTFVLLESLARALGQQEVAAKASVDVKKTYEDAAASLKTKADAYTAAAGELKNAADAIKQDITKVLDTLKTQSSTRMDSYTTETKQLRDKIDVHLTDLTRANTKIKSLDEAIAGYKLDRAAVEETKKKGEQFFDEPLGHITRRLPDNTVEIDIGSHDKARAGLTFSVLPADFPVKGYQSRVQTFRIADDRNVFRETPRFVEKATLEIVEVLGPHSSRARITETDPIRDRVLQGDLLYNAAWRRGYVDHVALFGVFDINGDGSDDIKNVVRDFEKMGIPVDAYFDLKEKKWVGQLTGKTRFAIKGNVPNPSGNDPFYGEKAALNSALAEAGASAKAKGITEISFRDLFPRMGYRVKLDVGDDKINQAVSQYLQTVAPAPN